MIFMLMIILHVPSFHIPSIADHNVSETDTRSINDLEFENRQIYRETDLVYRSAYGDLIPSRDGMEMATCSRNGKVVVTYGSGYSWTSELAHRSLISATETAEVTSIVAGDILPEHNGDEILAVDKDCNVNLIRHDEDRGWVSEIIMDDPFIKEWLWDVDFGELVENGDQKEIVVVDDSRRVYLLTRNDTHWDGEVILTDGDVFDSCVIVDILPEYYGNEIVLGGGRGVIVIAYQENGIWKKEDVMDIGPHILDIVVEDIDPAISGMEIYACTLKGNEVKGGVISVWRENSSWVNRTVHIEGKTIYGMESGVIDGMNVLSIATYGHRVGLIYKDTDWVFLPIYTEEYNIMGTGIFDIDPTKKGQEILSLSYYGRVTLIYREDKGTEIILPFDSTTTSPGTSLKIPLLIEGTGGFEGQISLSLDTSIDAYLEDETLTANNFTIIRISSPNDPGSYRIEIIAEDQYGQGSGSLELIVDDQNDPYMLDPILVEAEVGIDRQVTKRMVLSSDVGLTKDIGVHSFLVPLGIQVSPETDLIYAGTGTPHSFDLTLSGTPAVEPGTYRFFLIVSDGQGSRQATGIELDVNERSLSDFLLTLEDPIINISPGENISTMLGVISLYGFFGEVNISIDNGIEGLKIELERINIIPTTDVLINISIDDAYGTFYIPIIGTSGDIQRETYLTIIIDPPKTTIELVLPEDPVLYEHDQDGIVELEFDIRIVPKNGIIEDISISVTGISKNYSISVFPGSIKRLAYPIDLKVRISGPIEEAPDELIFHISSLEPEIQKEGIVLIEKNESIIREDDNGKWGPAVKLAGVIVLIITSCIIAFFLLRANNLNQQENVVTTHGDGKVNDRSDTSRKRIDSSSGSHSRFDR
ncbi:MAG: hypothetical protein U9R75_03500 [Candidatus Thermoplasmatota archaeon]|nr:hypothetical protein [Candidatus Thermoplasmatota archaeon]